MPPNAQKIYERLISKESLYQLIHEKVGEDIYLEFKQKEDKTKPEPDQKDKKNFSEALSQFANTEGGVIVFGVKTSKPGDVASALEPITKPQIFLERLMDFAPHAVSPYVDGLIGKVIEDENDSGFVILYIPMSYKLPHMSLVSNKYHGRTQIGKRDLSHNEIGGMFGRRERPVLQFSLKLVEKKIIDKMPVFRYSIILINEGREIAEKTFIILEIADSERCNVRFILNPGIKVNKNDKLNQGRNIYSITTGEAVLYPEIPSSIGELELSFLTSYEPPTDFPALQVTLVARHMFRKDISVIPPGLFK